MGYIEGNCPKCGAKIRENCNAWVYGSPIRKCPKCKAEFLDKRWREVAIEGFAPETKNPKLYLIATVGFLIFTIVCALWLINMIKTRGYYPIKLMGCIGVGVIGTIGCALVFLRIVTGYEDKQNAKFMMESQKRLQDKDYVEKLVGYGYSTWNGKK